MRPALPSGRVVHVLNPGISEQSYRALAVRWVRARRRAYSTSTKVGCATAVSVSAVSAVTLIGMLGWRPGPAWSAIVVLAAVVATLARNEVRAGWAWCPPAGNLTAPLTLRPAEVRYALSWVEWGSERHWALWAEASGEPRAASLAVPVEFRPAQVRPALANALDVMDRVQSEPWAQRLQQMSRV